MSKKRDLCVFNYSSRLEKPSGFGSDGKLVLSQYTGKTTVIETSITDIQEQHNSPSIAVENDVAHFTIIDGASIPYHLGC